MSSTARGLGVAAGGLLYFALVFAAGFALGVLRVLWLLPRLGERLAELVELPFMLAVCAFAARFVVRRLTGPRTALKRLGVGTLALALLLAAECGVVIFLRGESLAEGFLERDPISGAAYWLSLSIFAALPLFVDRAGSTAERRTRSPNQ